MKTNSPGQSPLLLLDVVDILNKLNVPYAVVGAFAASFYGTVRASLDADAVISVKDLESQSGLIAQLAKQGLKVDFNRGDREDPVVAVINVQDSFYNRVDLLLGIRGMDAKVFERTMPSRFMGSSVEFIGLEDFIAMKIFAGSAKDIQDVVGVLKVSGKRANLALLRELTLKYGKDELKKLEKLLSGGY